jgi:hypothetical protein
MKSEDEIAPSFHTIVLFLTRSRKCCDSTITGSVMSSGWCIAWLLLKRLPAWMRSKLQARADFHSVKFSSLLRSNAMTVEDRFMRVKPGALSLLNYLEDSDWQVMTALQPKDGISCVIFRDPSMSCHICGVCIFQPADNLLHIFERKPRYGVSPRAGPDRRNMVHQRLLALPCRRAL